jgi:hypothetical protein
VRRNTRPLSIRATFLELFLILLDTREKTWHPVVEKKDMKLRRHREMDTSFYYYYWYIPEVCPRLERTMP